MQLRFPTTVLMGRHWMATSVLVLLGIIVGSWLRKEPCPDVLVSHALAHAGIPVAFDCNADHPERADGLPSTPIPCEVWGARIKRIGLVGLRHLRQMTADNTWSCSLPAPARIRA